MQLDYYVTSVIHLSLEDYTNAGISQQRCKEIIESVDPELDCEHSGVNHNLNVRTRCTHPVSIETLVLIIRYKLDMELKSKGSGGKVLQ